MEDDIPQGRLWFILIIIVCANMLISIVGTIVPVALPNIAESLGTSMEDIAWIQSAYFLPIAMIIMLVGRLGDVFGKIKVFKIGVSIYTVGALCCTLSWSLGSLIISRIILAVGSAGIMATCMGMIAQIFPKDKTGRALGFLTTFMSAGALLGPVLGGLILEVASWKYIFAFNVPIGILVMIFTQKFLPNKLTGDASKAAVKIDYPGVVLFAVFIFSFFMSFQRVNRYGISNPYIILGFVVAVIGITAFIICEKRTANALLPLGMFKNIWFSVGVVSALFAYLMTTCQGYLFPIYLQKASGLSPGVSGLVLAIPALVLAGLAPLSGYLADKVGARYLVIGAFILLATGAFLIASVNSNTAVSVAVVFLMIVAMGNAFFQAPNNKLIMSNLDKSYLGIGGSVAQLMRYLGMQSGTTVTVLILYSRMSRISGTRVSSYVDGKPEIFMSGMQMVYLTIGILMLVCIVLNIIKPLSESLKTKKGN